MTELPEIVARCSCYDERQRKELRFLNVKEDEYAIEKDGRNDF
jgi:redox-regulated HSP33 family molecular chaperone